MDIDTEGRVVSLAGLPEVDAQRIAGSFLFTGCHVLDESLLDRLPGKGPSNILDLYRDLAAEGRLGAHFHTGFWWEFGSPRHYLDGSLRLLDCSVERRRRISGDHDTVRQLDRAMVITRSEFDYLAASRLGDNIVVATWLTHSDGRRSLERRFQVDYELHVPGGPRVEIFVGC